MAGRPIEQRWLGDVLLGLLLGRSRYGLELVDRVHEAWSRETGGTGELAEGTVYATLRGLERRGLLAGQWQDAGDERPRRRYYALTPKGQGAAEMAPSPHSDPSRAARGARA